MSPRGAAETPVELNRCAVASPVSRRRGRHPPPLDLFSAALPFSAGRGSGCADLRPPRSWGIFLSSLSLTFPPVPRRESSHAPLAPTPHRRPPPPPLPPHDQRPLRRH